MSAFHILALQSTLSLVSFALIAKWHVAPRLARRPVEEALIPLIWVHVFRYTPMTMLVPGQVDPDIPGSVARAIAFGDLVSGLAALAALLALKYRFRGALALTWLFNVVGISDIAYAMVQGIGAELFRYALGWNWYILNFYVPVLCVTHAMMVARLLAPRAPRGR